MNRTSEDITLVFATHNINKIKEIKVVIPSQIELLSLEDIGCTEEIPETADTIEGNAFMKSVYVKENFGLDCFADDTGLEVEALNGAPGVYSARYAGEEKDNEANIAKLLKELEGKSNRKASFKTVISLILNDEHFSFTGICAGQIITEPRGNLGFGYDSVFQPEGQTSTFAEMDLTEKTKISHRAMATRALIEFLAKQT